MIVLKADSEYDIYSFPKGFKEIKIENQSLYGENKTRNEMKIIDIEGYLVRDITKIIVESGSMVIFKFYNSLGEIVLEYIMNIYERFIVKNTSFGTLRYGFVKQ